MQENHKDAGMKSDPIRSFVFWKWASNSVSAEIKASDRCWLQTWKFDLGRTAGDDGAVFHTDMVSMLVIRYRIVHSLASFSVVTNESMDDLDGLAA